MKSILLPIDQSEQMPSALETAWHLASLFEATVEGVALRPAFAEIVAPDPIVAVTIPPADWNEVEFCRGVRQTFDAFAAQHSGEQGRGVRFRWRGGSAIEDSALGSLARVYDVTVLSRPGNRGARMTALEATLFDSGRPVLMAPPRPPKSLAQTVLIHWNASTETARAILLAMPILRKAKRVSLVAVEGHIVPGPSVKDALGHLEANGVVATEKTVVGARNRQGEAILTEATAIGADLLIKGAYTQSRLRQMIFGGATSHILASAELPVFLAH
ncbi:MAG TPA: universal stress protein [Hyphomicrobiaceae bacterium]|jgi:nucleotide-binding universal stress UspA family protein|nr:universal stress protein [Hyphomicrobiaceae bacterium]